MNAKPKKFIGILLRVAAISAIAVLMTIITENYFVPWAGSNQFFSRLSLIQKAGEKTTIINKTEQITVREDDSVSTATSKAVPSVVQVISIEKSGEGNNGSGVVFRSGTGVVATNDGMIITHRSVLKENNSTYKIIAPSGSSYEGRLIGIDNFTDLAFLKIGAFDLTPISFANSDDFRAGKKLVSIAGGDGDYQYQFGSGLLSYLNKTFNIAGKALSSTEKMEGVIETDFLNGESFVGGPLVSFNGELVGIIGKVIANNETRYFAVPSNIVKAKLELAIQNKIGGGAYFGAYYFPVTKKLAAAMNLPREEGALVYSPSGKQGLAIISGSPAEKAGIKIFDIIVKVNNRDINLDNPLSNVLSQYKKGDSIELSILRDGKEIKITAILQ
jgi:S1-C subfamily serine protease